MSFIIRGLLILIIFAFAVYVLKMIARLTFNLRGAIKDVKNIREQVAGRPVASAEMVRCSTCGSFISSRDAVTVSTGNRPRIFCSQECVRVPAAK